MILLQPFSSRLARWIDLRTSRSRHHRSRPASQLFDAREVEARLNAALDWICLARLRSNDGGVSKGYDVLRRRWFPAYPETTGYTIPSLLNAATAANRPELTPVGLSLADYLLGVATPEGGVAHWASQDRHPIVFDTGQVIFGWLAAFRVSGDDRYKRAAGRAGDWLVSTQDSSGCWKDHQHLGTQKVIDTRVAWALLELDQLEANSEYRRAAVRNLEWALQQQDPDGWFRNCAFGEGEDPFTHTIAYTAEGLLECGRILQERRYVDAARLTSESLRRRQRTDGYLSSTFGPGWRATSRSCCLTGNCQMTRLWLTIGQTTGEEAYVAAARRSLAFVAGTQLLGPTVSPEHRGAIAGSFPLYGRYERFKYPNWAAKFFVDALLVLQHGEGRTAPPVHAG